MHAIKSDSPLFIIGSPRSGTSLLRLILTSHSQILVPPECGFIIWLHAKYENWQLKDNSVPAKVRAFLNDLSTCKKFDTWQLPIEKIKEQIGIQQPSNYKELCNVVYYSFGLQTGKYFDIWGDKNNFYLNHLNELLGLYKDARFLHIVRDGRDVACSYREVMAAKSTSQYAPKLETGIVEIAMEWSTNIIKIDSFMSTLSPKSVMTIRYEDLVVNPKQIIGRICGWLEIAFEPGMIDFYQQNRRKGLEPVLTLDWKKRTLQPISDKTVKRYISMLSIQDQHKFQEIAANVLRQFSYL